MKLSSVALSFLPATMAAECYRYGGCAGCGVVSSVSFTQTSDDVYVATAGSWGVVTLNSTHVTVQNTASKWALFCLYGSSCFPQEGGDSCSTTRSSTDVPSRGLMVWST